MTAYKVTYLIWVLFSIIGCERNHISEEKILSDIFPQLVDSLHIKWRPMPPPPPPPLFDKDSDFVGFDSTKMELILLKHQTYLRRIDSKDSRIIIGIADSCFLIDWNGLKFRTYSEDEIVSTLIIMNEPKTNVSKELNLSQIDTSNDLKLVLESEIDKKYTNIRSTFKNHKFAGLLKFSRIYLLETSDFGLLQTEYYLDEWDGYSFFIVIEKTDKKWRVKRLLKNWVS